MNAPTHLPPHIRRALTTLSTVAPELAGRIAAYLAFRTTRRHLDPRGRALLERGRQFEVRDGQRRIAAWTWGMGPIVHLAHGWSSRADQLAAFVAPLVASGHQVVAHDSPGHGESSGRSSSVVEMADALAAVASSTGPAHAIIGYEHGGTAAVIAIARGLSVSRATFISMPADTSRWAAALSLPLDAAAADAAKRLAERRLGTPLESLALPTLGKSIQVPVLVVHDRHDDRVPFDDALLTVRSISDAGLIVTDGLGHTGAARDGSLIDEIVEFTAARAQRRLESPERVHDRVCARPTPAAEVEGVLPRTSPRPRLRLV